MRSMAMMAGMVMGAMLTVPAMAAGQGQYGDALKTMLTRTAAGDCPADLMGDQLLAACHDQLGKMQPALVAAGPITALAFVKATGDKDTPIETYTVTFGKGSTATWQIGRFQGGKYQAAYSEG